MPTKLFIEYKEPHSSWIKASVVVLEEINDIDEADSFLDGSDVIKHLVDMSTYNRLDNWRVLNVEATEEVENLDKIVIEEVEKTIKKEKLAKSKKQKKTPDVNVSKKGALKARINKTNSDLDKEIKKISKEIEKSRKELDAYIAETKAETERLRNENINKAMEHFELTKEEAIFYLENFSEKYNDNDKKRFFRVHPEEIRRDFAEANKLEYQRKTYFDTELKKSGKFIKVLDKLVDYQLFYDYFNHLAKDIKMWKASEFEVARCELHQRIFEACGGDRIDNRDDEIGNAISDIICDASRCVCGGSIGLGHKCIECGRKVGFSDYIHNLKEMIEK